MKIDVFGNGKHVYEEENLPDEIINNDGRWVKSEQQSYYLGEPSQSYIDNNVKPGQEQANRMTEEIEYQGKLVRKMTEMAENALQKWQCSLCDYIYDPELGDPDSPLGILPGTPFKYLPTSWTCPSCGAEKKKFNKCKKDD